MNTSSAPSLEVAHGLEAIACYGCGETSHEEFVLAQDDLTGRPGQFRFVTCARCGLVYQNPRIRLEDIKGFYGEDYIAHRQSRVKGWWESLLRFALDGVERRKDRLVRNYLELDASHRVLDVGCGAGGFLQRVRQRYGAHTSGVDFKDLSAHPCLAGSRFCGGLFYEQDFGEERFDLVTMWHFLEHDYDPLRSLETARSVLARQGLLIVEVPRLDSLTQRLFQERWPGLQAPQHTVLFSRESLMRLAQKAGLQAVDYLPYGAFPAYYYLFTGAAFKLRRGRGLSPRRAIVPYLLGQALLWPILRFEQRLNLAMQTLVCRGDS
jgi:SAM-dependent methyltransferase